jgi:segregation and condensation protein B
MMDEHSQPIESMDMPERVEADERLLAIVESVLFAAGEPLNLARLADAIPGPTRAELRQALTTLGDRARQDGRGVRLVEVAGGYQLRTAPEHAQWVRRLFQQKPWRLTRATLETLAIIAYKQPITRAEIEAIRGVDVDSVLASLLSRKLVRIVGRKEVVGRPLLYGSTRQFLEVFGLRDLGSLPALSEVVQPMPDGVAAGAAASEGVAEGDGELEDPAADGAAATSAGGGGRVLAPDGGAADQPGQGDRERQHDHGPGHAGEGD